MGKDDTLLEKIKKGEKLTDKDIHSDKGLKTEQRSGYEPRFLQFERDKEREE